jgi:hypothetical protein
VVKHTPMAPAAKTGLRAIRARSDASVGPRWLTELALALGRHDVAVSGGRRRRLSNRTVRYRVRAALRLWRAMW